MKEKLKNKARSWWNRNRNTIETGVVVCGICGLAGCLVGYRGYKKGYNHACDLTTELENGGFIKTCIPGTDQYDPNSVADRNKWFMEAYNYLANK